MLHCSISFYLAEQSHQIRSELYMWTLLDELPEVRKKPFWWWFRLLLRNFFYVSITACFDRARLSSRISFFPTEQRTFSAICRRLIGNLFSRVSKALQFHMMCCSSESSVFVDFVDGHLLIGSHLSSYYSFTAFLGFPYF